MSTARKAPAKKATTTRATKKVATKKATKTARKAADQASPLAEMRAARQFALEHNMGLSSRVRMMLDENKAALKILVDEGLPIPKIQQYIKDRWGPKIGPTALTAYIESSFPARTRTVATKKRVTKRVTRRKG